MKTIDDMIKIPEIDYKQAADEIGDFIVKKVIDVGSTGGVIGLSGGVDSTTAAALAKRAFDQYNKSNEKQLELVGYILPSKTNAPEDKLDGEKVANRLGIRYETHSIEPLLEAFKLTNPEAFTSNYDKGNLASRVRSNVLNTKAATEKKILLGTGNKDEDFGIGYYTLFGDGAVHMSPLGSLSKRLVRGMASYLGFQDLADRIPTAGLEPGQTDFKDLGYYYDAVEVVIEGMNQGFDKETLYKHPQVIEAAHKSVTDYRRAYGQSKFKTTVSLVDDILFRHYNIAEKKSEIISPPIAPVTLTYK